MIGFFEHQYLSYKKNHLSNLIALAKVDGNLHPEEEKMLYKMGEIYGLKDRQIASLINYDERTSLNIPKSHEQKMNQLYDLVTMIYADGKVEESEVHFCEELMIKFGFKREVVQWMINMLGLGKPPTPEVWKELVKEAAEKYIH